MSTGDAPALPPRRSMYKSGAEEAEKVANFAVASNEPPADPEAPALPTRSADAPPPAMPPRKKSFLVESSSPDSTGAEGKPKTEPETVATESKVGEGSAKPDAVASAGDVNLNLSSSGANLMLPTGNGSPAPRKLSVGREGAKHVSTLSTVAQCGDREVLASSLKAPVMVGFLKKRAADRNKWQARYFVLDSSVMYYFREATDKTSSGSFVALGQLVGICPKDGRANTFFVGKQSSRVYWFEADTEREVQSWITALCTHALCQRIRRYEPGFSGTEARFPDEPMIKDYRKEDAPAIEVAEEEETQYVRVLRTVEATGNADLTIYEGEVLHAVEGGEGDSLMCESLLHKRGLVKQSDVERVVGNVDVKAETKKAINAEKDREKTKKKEKDKEEKEEKKRAQTLKKAEVAEFKAAQAQAAKEEKAKEERTKEEKQGGTGAMAEEVAKKAKSRTALLEGASFTEVPNEKQATPPTPTSNYPTPPTDSSGRKMSVLQFGPGSAGDSPSTNTGRKLSSAAPASPVAETTPRKSSNAAPPSVVENKPRKPSTVTPPAPIETTPRKNSSAPPPVPPKNVPPTQPPPTQEPLSPRERAKSPPPPKAPRGNLELTPPNSPRERPTSPEPTDGRAKSPEPSGRAKSPEPAGRAKSPEPASPATRALSPTRATVRAEPPPLPKKPSQYQPATSTASPAESPATPSKEPSASPAATSLAMPKAADGSERPTSSVNKPVPNPKPKGMGVMPVLHVTTGTLNDPRFSRAIVAKYGDNVVVRRSAALPNAPNRPVRARPPAPPPKPTNIPPPTRPSRYLKMAAGGTDPTFNLNASASDVALTPSGSTSTDSPAVLRAAPGTATATTTATSASPTATTTSTAPPPAEPAPAPVKETPPTAPAATPATKVDAPQVETRSEVKPEEKRPEPKIEPPVAAAAVETTPKPGAKPDPKPEPVVEAAKIQPPPTVEPPASTEPKASPSAPSTPSVAPAPVPEPAAPAVPIPVPIPASPAAQPATPLSSTPIPETPLSPTRDHGSDSDSGDDMFREDPKTQAQITADANAAAAAGPARWRTASLEPPQMLNESAADAAMDLTAGSSFGEAARISAAPSKLGFLNLRSSKLRKWDKRWVVLDQSVVYLFKTPNDANPKKTFVALGQVVGQFMRDNKQHTFFIGKANAPTYWLQAESDEEMHDWLAVFIKDASCTSSPVPPDGTEMSSTMRMTRRETVTEREEELKKPLPVASFKNPAKTGFLNRRQQGSKKWERRFVVLDASVVYSYKDIEDLRPVETFVALGQCVGAMVRDGRSGSFFVGKANAPTHWFQADDDAAMNSWIDVLQKEAMCQLSSTPPDGTEATPVALPPRAEPEPEAGKKAPAPMPPSSFAKPDKVGFLQRRVAPKKWEQRYCVFDNMVMYLYKEFEDQRPCETFVALGQKTGFVGKDARSSTFFIGKANAPTYWLQADNDEQAHAWVAAFTKLAQCEESTVPTDGEAPTPTPAVIPAPVEKLPPPLPVSSFAAPTKAGWLNKRSGNTKRWDPRYVVLDNLVVYMYKELEDPRPIETFVALGQKVGAQAKDTKTNSFFIGKSNAPTYWLEADSPESAAAWVESFVKEASCEVVDTAPDVDAFPTTASGRFAKILGRDRNNSAYQRPTDFSMEFNESPNPTTRDRAKSDFDLTKQPEKETIILVVEDNDMTVEYRALFDWTAQSSEELSFKHGDILQIVDTSNPHWYYGSLNGVSGDIPATYVEIMDAARIPYRALYDYTAQSTAQVSFREGELVQVTDSSDPVWYFGSVRGVFGEVPANYLEKITHRDYKMTIDEEAITNTLRELNVEGGGELDFTKKELFDALAPTSGKAAPASAAAAPTDATGTTPTTITTTTTTTTTATTAAAPTEAAASDGAATASSTPPIEAVKPPA